jgi:putative hemolysin
VAFVELALIPISILLNGFFAGAEIALLSAARPALSALAARGSRAAEAALRLKDRPEAFLPTVQVGITLAGSLASAIGGLNIVSRLMPRFAPYLGPSGAEIAALALVVGAISVLTLVVGELAPKHLALKYPESYAVVAALPLQGLERIAWPIVRLLDLAAAALLWPVGGRRKGGARVTRDELRSVLTEGHRQGAYSEVERVLIDRVIGLLNETVGEAALPRVATPTVGPGAGWPEVRRQLLASQSALVVVYDPASDQVFGVLGWRDAFGDPAGAPAACARKVIYVPESAPLPQALEQMQAAGAEAAAVVNEYGEFEGFLTASMAFQRHVLAFALPQRAHPDIRPLANGWRIRGGTTLAILREQLALPLEDSVFYTTLGGFVLEGLGRVPAPGDTFDVYGYRFTVEAMDRNRIDTVAVTRL